jgi:predicted RNase H-like HicB family nuclease
MVAAVIALIHGRPGNYGISFPDFPGCISGGITIDEALRRGREALTFHIEGMEAVGESLPKVREIEEIRADPEYSEDLQDAIIAAADIDVPTRAVRVNISIDERLLARADKAAEAAGETRSGYIAGALKQRLASNSSMPVSRTVRKRTKRARRQTARRDRPAGKSTRRA